MKMILRKKEFIDKLEKENQHQKDAITKLEHELKEAKEKKLAK